MIHNEKLLNRVAAINCIQKPNTTMYALYIECNYKITKSMEQSVMKMHSLTHILRDTRLINTRKKL